MRFVTFRYQISLQLESQQSLGKSVDEILASLSGLNPDDINQVPFKEELLRETIDNL